MLPLFVFTDEPGPLDTILGYFGRKQSGYFSTPPDGDCAVTSVLQTDLLLSEPGLSEAALREKALSLVGPTRQDLMNRLKDSVYLRRLLQKSIGDGDIQRLVERTFHPANPAPSSVDGVADLFGKPANGGTFCRPPHLSRTIIGLTHCFLDFQGVGCGSLALAYAAWLAYCDETSLRLIRGQGQ
jgi:hypothetical protein